MDYKNAEVALTVALGGARAIIGQYEFKQTGIAIEKTESGIVKSPVGNLIIKQLPVNHNAEVRVTLKSDFVNFAVSDESAPRKAQPGFWKNLSKKNRLKYHIEKYVGDVYGGGSYEYQVLE